MSIVLRLQIGKAERILRGQAHYWKVMRALQAEHGEITTSAIDAASNADSGDIRKFVRALVAAGYVQPVGETGRLGPGGPEKTYRIVRDQAECPRLAKSGVQGTGQRNMWNVLRGPLGRDGIDARDLAAFASTDGIPIALDTARTYLKMLAQAGYLACLAKGGPGKLAVWRLKPSMNTGPLPPMILRAKLVYDQNAGRVMGEATAEEDRP
ncbi:MAG: hypothetical protein WA975_21570 [Mesorhizobium sp.]